MYYNIFSFILPYIENVINIKKITSKDSHLCTNKINWKHNLCCCLGPYAKFHEPRKTLLGEKKQWEKKERSNLMQQIMATEFLLKNWTDLQYQKQIKYPDIQLWKQEMYHICMLQCYIQWYGMVCYGNGIHLTFWSERRCADGEVAIKIGIIFSSLLSPPVFY